uniref:HNH endonuclease n=1 Tax=Candidatus Electrothrix sp. TaxID=2170559 RepID=UPI004056FFA9
MSKTYISVALRTLVYKRAKAACEYCLIPEMITFAPHQIDHIIAEKHSGETQQNNLALACILCNKYKGSDIASVDPATGNIVALYNPRQDSWEEHFHLEKNGNIQPLTGIGRGTLQLLRFNTPERISERRLLYELFKKGIKFD